MAQEKNVKQNKYEEGQMRRRWCDIAIAVAYTAMFLINLRSHHTDVLHSPWVWGTIAIFSCVQAVYDWQLTFAHRRMASAGPTDKHH